MNTSNRKRWKSLLRANTKHPKSKNKDYFTFLKTNIIPWEVVFSDEQYHFPELNLILFHESVTTYLRYRIGSRNSITLSVNLFNINHLIFNSDIKINTYTYNKTSKGSRLPYCQHNHIFLLLTGWSSLTSIWCCNSSHSNLPRKLTAFPNTIC